MMQATVIRVVDGQTQISLVASPVQTTRLTQREARAIAIQAYQSIYPDVPARCDYQVDGAWEIVSESLPMTVLGAVVLESA